jgi:DNA-directed RNA polymerase subunit RPC12/RpoP
MKLTLKIEVADPELAARILELQKSGQRLLKLVMAKLLQGSLDDRLRVYLKREGLTREPERQWAGTGDSDTSLHYVCEKCGRKLDLMEKSSEFVCPDRGCGWRSGRHFL